MAQNTGCMKVAGVRQRATEKEQRSNVLTQTEQKYTWVPLKTAPNIKRQRHPSRLAYWSPTSVSNKLYDIHHANNGNQSIRFGECHFQYNITYWSVLANYCRWDNFAYLRQFHFDFYWQFNNGTQTHTEIRTQSRKSIDFMFSWWNPSGSPHRCSVLLVCGKCAFRLCEFFGLSNGILHIDHIQSDGE